MKNTKPNYYQIYNDILTRKFPEKRLACETILRKKELDVMDILEINRLIFGSQDEETDSFNQQHRSYDKSDILKMLDYQKKHNLNNIQLAKHFRLSRNTVSKWKKMFQI